VYLNHVAAPSGAEWALLRLLPALTSVRPHVILAEDGWLRGALEGEGIPVEVLPFPDRTRNLRKERIGRRLPLSAVTDTVAYVGILRRRLRELRPDLVHTNSLKASVYGTLASRAAGIPSVWHAHDRIASDYLPRLAVVATRQLVRHVPAGVISVSEVARASALGRRNGRMVTQTIHDPFPLPELPVRAPHRTGDAAFVVGMTSRITRWKGQDTFLRAFAMAFRGDPTTHARIIGTALFDEVAFERSLHDLVRELGIADQVTFVGHSDDVWSELAGLDVLVHASRTAEPFGQVLVEGMGAGCAVLCADAGGPLEIVENGVSGLYARANDPADYARQLQRLRADPELRARLAEGGRIAAATRFSPEVISRQVEAFYERVLARTGTPPRAT
jgi:glycosyltransferase involved in cell wall biosynthesis